MNLLLQEAKYHPPLQSSATAARDRQHIQARINAVGIEIVRYLIFLYLVLLMAYARRDTNIYWQNKSISDIFFYDEGFDEVNFLFVCLFIIWLLP